MCPKSIVTCGRNTAHTMAVVKEEFVFRKLRNKELLNTVYAGTINRDFFYYSEFLVL